jgi:sulfate transporter 3
VQIGDLPRGVNPPSMNMLQFSGSYVALSIKTGIMTGILSLTVRSILRFSI